MLTSRLGEGLGGGDVLDVFAGSGALGIEALSRGAASCTFFERDPKALAALSRNVHDLSLDDRVTTRRGDSFTLARQPAHRPYSLIMLDPPYTLDAARIAELIVSLVEGGAVAEGTFVSWEHDSGRPVIWPDAFEPVAGKRYGSIGLDVARYARGADRT